MFKLHPRLDQDCKVVGDFPLCRLLLMNDANYPWFILVPKRDGIREIFELSHRDQIQLLRESSHLAKVLMNNFDTEKLNIAALGNIVPQLHIHHIARNRNDRAWPKPVWGHCNARPYSQHDQQKVIFAVIEHLPDFVPHDEFPDTTFP